MHLDPQICAQQQLSSGKSFACLLHILPNLIMFPDINKSIVLSAPFNTFHHVLIYSENYTDFPQSST